jgi:hypothetical protein
MVTPNRSLPTKMPKNPWAQAWTRINAPPKTTVTKVSIFGAYRDTQTAIIIIKPTFAQKGAELNMPCCIGVRPKSEVIEGNKIPIVFAIRNPMMLHMTKSV